MKELIVADVSVISEDGDSWEDLIKVVKRANKAYLESIRELNQGRIERWIRKLLKK